MTRLLLAALVCLLAINAEADFLCWLDPTAGVCGW